MALNAVDDDNDFNDVLNSALGCLSKSVELAVSEYQKPELKKQFADEAMALVKQYVEADCRRTQLIKCAGKVEKAVYKSVDPQPEVKFDDFEVLPEEDLKISAESASENDEPEELPGIENLNNQVIMELDADDLNAEVDEQGADDDTDDVSDSEAGLEHNLSEIDPEKIFVEETKKLSNATPRKHPLLKKYIADIKELLTTEHAVVVQASENITDPITKMVMTNPMRNKKCGHNYDRDSIKQYFTNKQYISCPYVGCKCDAFTLRDLEENMQLAMKIRAIAETHVDGEEALDVNSDDDSDD